MIVANGGETPNTAICSDMTDIPHAGHLMTPEPAPSIDEGHAMWLKARKKASESTFELTKLDIWTS